MDTLPDLIRLAFAREIAHIEEAILSAHPSDFTEYKVMVARRHALQYGAKIAIEAIQEQDTEEDDLP